MLSRGRRDDRHLATTVFRFVRDRVRYAFGPWDTSASETLLAREGTCANKSTLLVALLRATGIPAAYGVLRVTAREYFGAVAPAAFKPLVSTNSVHIYAAAYLGGRWVRCDCSTDADIAARTSHFCAQTRLLHWDGIHDAMDALDPAHIHADLGLRASIDELLEKPPVNSTPDVLRLLNDYVAFIRRHPPFGSAVALHGAYFERRIDRVGT